MRLSKKLGQNLLIDHNIIDIILRAANIKEDDIVLEIGPGIGSLTQGLLEKNKKGRVIAVERDGKMVEVLDDLFKEESRLELLEEDVLKVNWTSFFKKRHPSWRKIKVVANLPYNIATAVISSLLETGLNFELMVFMVQKEVARRITARPGGKEYGVLSIAVQYYTVPVFIHEVSPAVFIPRPAVNSAIVKLVPSQDPEVSPINEEFFFSVVKAIFQQRRKTIKNALKNAINLNLDKGVIEESLRSMGINILKRGEKLSPEEMIRLSNVLWENTNGNPFKT